MNIKTTFFTSVTFFKRQWTIYSKNSNDASSVLLINFASKLDDYKKTS